MKFKFLLHTADIKFQAFGKTIEKCFENAAYALKEVITKDKIKPIIKKIIKVKGKDLEELLYNFLEEFLFLMDTENLVLSKITKIKINRNNKNRFELSSEVYFDRINNYKTISDVKAITYNEMFIKGPSNDGNCLKKEKGKFTCQVVVDV